jgi:hypothetical protein
MAGLVPAIHKLTATPMSMDGRHKGGHDDDGMGAWNEPAAKEFHCTRRLYIH